MHHSTWVPDSGHAGEFLVAAGKAAPPIAVSGMAVAGVALSDWVVILTLVFLVLQIAHLLFKWGRDLTRGGGCGE